MRIPYLSPTVIVVLCCAVLGAEERKFPYQAIVETDGEYVRSGPGPNFYPTDKLKKGDKVTVIRHDLGGWCMITPRSEERRVGKECRSRWSPYH